MKKYLLNLLITASLFAGTYDNTYSVEQMKDVNGTEIINSFMDGSYSEIKRFDALEFKDESFSEDSKENLESIVSYLKKYIDDGENIIVKVIGHARERTDIHNELAVDSDTYANRIQNMFRFSQTEEETQEKSEEYTAYIVKELEDNNISKDIIIKEFRGSKDLGFTTATEEGIDLSKRVMVSMYVIAPEDKDEDEDGVLDSMDRCPQTPNTAKVDNKGCPLDLDKDGIADYKDSCLDTPSGVSIDAKGCPLDSGGDGVFDYKDDCPAPAPGMDIDAKGCPVSQYIRLKFARLSSEIPDAQYSQVKRFVDFLQENKAYKIQIIGHTDSVGKKGVNMVLSNDRAYAVKAALIKEGISEDRIEAIGRGELDPIETNRTAEGRAINRRIEVKLFN